MVLEFDNQILGCVFGGVLGDSLGYPVEFCNVKSMDKYKMLEKPYNLKVFSDDTQMTLFTMEGLINSTEENVIDSIYSAYKYWLSTQYNYLVEHDYAYESELYKEKSLHNLRAPGNTCLSALTVGREDVSNDSCGCGGVMRVAPIGLFYDDEEAYKIAKEAARLTHLNPLGYEPAGVLAAIISNLCSLNSLEWSIKKAIRLTDNDELRKMLNTAIRFAKKDYDDLVIFEDQKWAGWTGHEALAIAVYCALKYDRQEGTEKEKFEKALLAAVHHDGDSDSTGSILGNILGTYYGIEALPVKIEELESYDLIYNLCEKFKEPAKQR